MQTYSIAPSLLSADFARLGEEAQAVLEAGGDLLHLDVMDNHYVPNLTVGPLVCQSLRDYGITAPIDVHLMTRPVDPLIKLFAKAGASMITFHPDATEQVAHSLKLIHELGCQAGLAINPGTALTCLEPFLDNIDLILMMSVNPGFGGQPFIPDVLAKVQQAKQMTRTSGKPIRLCIDGGINVDNIQSAAKAGADTFVAGSSIFKHPPYRNVIQAMRQQLAGT